MNDKLKEIIQLVKSELRKDPSTTVIGKLDNGIRNEINSDNSYIQLYFEFLKECNGARCGSIDFWNFETFLKRQYQVSEIPGGKDNWVYIGQILYEPILINIINGRVYRFYQGHETDISADCFCSFDEFLMKYVFGDKYAEIIPNAEKEEWYQLLKKINLV